MTWLLLLLGLATAGAAIAALRGLRRDTAEFEREARRLPTFSSRRRRRD